MCIGLHNIFYEVLAISALQQARLYVMQSLQDCSHPLEHGNSLCPQFVYSAIHFHVPEKRSLELFNLRGYIKLHVDGQTAQVLFPTFQ